MQIKDIISYVTTNVLSDRPRFIENLDDNTRVLADDVIVARLLDDAQDNLAVDTHFIVDRLTPDISIYTLEIDVNNITLHPRVISIYDDYSHIVNTATGCTHELTRVRPRRRYILSSDIPNCYIIRRDSAESTTLYLQPNVALDTLELHLEVALRPAIRFSDVPNETKAEKKIRLNSECELPPQFHERLADYVMFRTTAHRDIDKNSKPDRDAAQKRWQQTCNDLNAYITRLNHTDDLVFSNPQF